MWTRAFMAGIVGMALLGCHGRGGGKSGDAGADAPASDVATTSGAAGAAGASGAAGGTAAAGTGAAGSAGGGTAGTGAVPDGGAGAAAGTAGSGPDAAASDDGPLTDAGYPNALVIKDFWPSSAHKMANARASAPAGDPVCYPSGWCWSDPTPFGGELAVAAIAANDVWVVGPHGVARHFDGQKWTNVPTPTTIDLKAVWGSATDQVWAAGFNVVLRWDGASWKALDTGDMGGDSLGGSGPNDLWLANSASGLWHFDGKTWNDVAAVGSTYDVFETPDGTLYASIGQVLGVLAPGATGAPDYLNSKGGFAANGVWAASATDVWQVHPSALMHFDGAAWTNRLQLQMDYWAPQMQKVCGTGPNDVWISAIDGTMLRWNGASLERWPSGAKHAEHISARAANDVWMAGWSGTVSHFDGQAWQRQGSGAQLTSLSLMGQAGDEVWALGEDVTGERIMRRRADGTWEELPSAFPPLFFLGVWGATADDVWVTGVDRTIAGPGGPILAHWDGAGWARARGLPTMGAYRAVWGSARNDVWVAGVDLRHWDGTAWQPVTVPGADGISWSSVAGAAKNEVWALGQSPTGSKLFRWDGAKWTEQPLPTGTVGKLSLRSANDVFAWSASAIQHFDGKTWTNISDLGHGVGDFTDVSVGPADVWTASIAGEVWTWNGMKWSLSETFSNGCNHVLARAKDVWVGCGFQGAGVLHLAR